jgi:hypothetical protein
MHADTELPKVSSSITKGLWLEHRTEKSQVHDISIFSVISKTLNEIILSFTILTMKYHCPTYHETQSHKHWQKQCLLHIRKVIRTTNSPHIQTKWEDPWILWVHIWLWPGVSLLPNSREISWRIFPEPPKGSHSKFLVPFFSSPLFPASTLWLGWLWLKQPYSTIFRLTLEMRI